MTPQTIDQLDTEWTDLSNFSCSPMVYLGRVYATAEHAFQAAKVLNQLNHETVRAARTPGEAKLLGNAFKDHPAWDATKLVVMTDILRVKFSTNKYLADLLMSTGLSTLVEGNTWGDTYWGACNGNGENHLGRILMKVREELRDNTLLVNDGAATQAIILKLGPEAASRAKATKLNHPYGTGGRKVG